MPGPAEETYRSLAQRLGLWLVPGSLYERSEGRLYNTAPVINPQGDVELEFPSTDAAAFLEWNRSPALDQLFAVRLAGGTPATENRPPARTGSVFFQEPLPLALDGFEQTNPFGRDKANPWLLSQLTPAGMYNRQRFVHALATLDELIETAQTWLRAELAEGAMGFKMFVGEYGAPDALAAERAFQEPRRDADPAKPARALRLPPPCPPAPPRDRAMSSSSAAASAAPPPPNTSSFTTPRSRSR